MPFLDQTMIKQHGSQGLKMISLFLSLYKSGKKLTICRYSLRDSAHETLSSHSNTRQEELWGLHKQQSEAIETDPKCC